MKKSKKNIKYYITTYLSDGIVTNRLEVSKTVFNKQYNDVLKQFIHQEKDSEFEVSMNTYIDERDTYFVKTTSFSYSICALDFTVLTCKENYYFTK